MAHVTPVASLPENSLNVLMGGFGFEGQQNQQMQNVAMQNIVNLIQQIIVQKSGVTQLKPVKPNLNVLGAQYAEMAHKTFSPISQPSTQDVKPSLGKRSKPEEKLIEVTPGGAEPAKRKRVYTKAACVSCRSSHLACDDGQPCRNCTKNGSKCERVEHTKIYVPPTLDEVLGTPSDGESTKSPSPAPSTDSNGARKYVKAACSCCRKSHLACDNYRPCRNCVRLELTCEEIRSQRRSRS
ncbi:hypothetical protein GUITHDRAFT_105045 [Guillardia theta CCMP2712]|uniref:Zn(2)-C6 fungal-type domain-containing protein n=1 Tax=Guillardia theta (strain CCMP2712) TaxID=905079 RepID=L1JKE1_GUITC|nr:hypothetical protein GUITHDRAFT_105045 [Guillardia theta CCMP2712]EKX48961.1 hypothetical protein GUITHDRAFT_105045 [Guillardia theta CCMP2712]|eukprot:XP_005835941.1 hypothetical protein GUITHDRAFT_105045 [Guillardia theta CCMP2712]